MLKPKYLLISAFLLCTHASYATTPDGHDTVSFKNGDTLTGNVVSGTTAGVVFSNHAVGSLTLKWSDLQSLSIKHDAHINCAGCPTQDFINPEITVDASSTPDHLNLSIKQMNKKLVALRDVQSVAPEAQPGPIEHPTGWTPTLSGSAGFIVSTQRDHSYASDISLDKNWYADGSLSKKTFIDLDAKYDDKRKNPSPGSATVTNYDSGKFQQFFFVPKTSSYVVLTSDLVRNNSLGIFFQQAYGAGVGTTIKQQLELDADLRFIGEHFYGPNSSQALAAAKLSAKYTLNLLVVGNGGKAPEDPAKTKLVQAIPSFSFVPVFNASRAWQMQGRINLIVPLTAKYALVPGLEDYYVENAPSPFRKNYLNVSVMLKVTPTAKH